MLQCVAVCHSALQCDVVCIHMYINVSCIRDVLQCVVVCCSVSQCVAVCRSVFTCVYKCLMHMNRSCVVNCTALQCVAVCCSALQCVAVCIQMPHAH